jgi:hypothetical protein
MKQLNSPVAIALSAFALSTLGLAQVTPVGPFTGDRSEGFEGQPTGFHVCLPNRVFNNTADVCSNNGAASMHTTSAWHFRCSILPYNGSRLFGSGSGGYAVFTFDNDIEAFGGYFGTNAWQPGQNHTVTVIFYDRQGGQIDSVLANVTDDCMWNWNGWSHPGIASIHVINSYGNGGYVDLDSLEVLDSAGVGTSFCNSNPNSTGVESVLTGSGSASLAANALRLDASMLPLSSFGYFLASDAAGNVANPGGSQGVLCLGGSIGRYVGPGQILNSGATGEYSLAVDLTAIPRPTGAVSASVGDTWFFQSWHRDANPAATSNFTNGLEVLILP